MAAALAYGWDGKRVPLYFQTRPGTYNDEGLIGFVRDLCRHLSGQQVILLWDELPSHPAAIGLVAAFTAAAAGSGLRGEFR